MYNGSIYQEHQPDEKMEIPFEDDIYDKMDAETPDLVDFELSNF